VQAVVLSDGERIACDRVLVGIGAVPEDRLGRDAGLACEDGVVVDAQGATSAERVWVAGDMTCRCVEGSEARRRLESIPSATEQARQVAAAIAGASSPAPEVPWFWSDQFELKLQICGLLGGEDAVTARGDPAADRFALFHTAAGRLIAVEAVNSPRDFMAGKTLLRERRPVDLHRLGDESVSLRELVAA
jgi:3-phenylpropionate/trans-cinnamate dioxygenase ferredoxin reductase subunit